MTYDAALEPYDAALEPYGAALEPAYPLVYFSTP